MPAKRKRLERPSVDGGRPSPHRPADTPLAQHDRDDGGGGGRGGTRGRGNRGGFGRRDSTHSQGRGVSSYHHSQQHQQNSLYQQSQHNQQPPTPSHSASFSLQTQPSPPPVAKQPKPPISPVATKQSVPSPTAARQPISPVATRAPIDSVQRQASPDANGYHYDNLTDEKVRIWAERGRDEIVRHGIQSREDFDITELSSLFQEFIHAVVEARLDAVDAGTCVKKILGEETSDVIKDSYAFAPHTLFLDSLAIVMENDSGLYRPALRDFLIATGVSPALMREVLDAPLLLQLGLIRDTFARLGVRQATNLLYRQANYNLLREESEGYSKLITEIFSANSVPPPPPGRMFEKVKALIGTFDLDVGRVLDVTLDVAAAVLIKQFKFFVKFLRTSSWWPSSHLNDGSSYVGGLPTWANPGYPHWSTSEEDEAENACIKLQRDIAFWDRAREVHLGAFFELGGRRVTDQHLQQSQITNGDAGDETAADSEQEWVRETNTLPAPGNRVAAQLLGFKLRFYNSDGRDWVSVLNRPLSLRLLINLAQYRQAAIYKILIQYLDFLWSNLEPAAFDAIVPDIPRLMSVFGLQTEVAFLIGRASLAHRMLPWKEAGTIKEDVPQACKPGTEKEGDVKMSDSKRQTAGATEMTAQAGMGTEDQQKPDDPSLSRTAFAALEPIVELVQTSVRPEVWRRITPELYTTFWALQLGDLCFPEHIYVKERQRVMNEWHALSVDRTDMSRRGLNQKTERRRELMDIQGYLLEELSEHGLRKAKWKFYLAKLFQSSFSGTAKSDSISDTLLEHCFLCRALLSPADAEYTYRFIKALHEGNAPVFKLMSLYDRLFNSNRLRTLIFTCTVREAEYLGRFLNLILEDLSRWHKNEPVPGDKDGKSAKDGPRLGAYDKEGKGSSDQPRLGFSLSVDENGKPDTFVEHAQFRDLLFRWHKNLNTALKTCLGGSEWMHIRNAITVLKAVLDHFPAVDFMATQFTAQLQNITKREAAPKATSESEEGGRVDLSVAAQGAMSELQKRKPKWVMVQAFRSTAAGGGSQSNTDIGSGSNLRPTAASFKPEAVRLRVNTIIFTEAEDGEVQDAKDGKGRSSTEGTPREYLPSRPSDSVRDSVSRQDEGPGPSRSSTPRAATSIPSNAEARSHKLPDRPSAHNLPSRPDVPIPGHIPPEHYSQSRGHDRRDGRDSREPRGSRDGRDTREAWDGRESVEPRELSREMRPSEPDRQGRAREYAERRVTDGTADGSRVELLPRPGQHDRDRQYRDSRGGRTQDRHNEALVGPPPTTNEPSGPAVNHDRAVFPQDGQDRPVRGSDPDRQPRAHRQGANDSMNIANAGRASLGEDRSDGAYSSLNRPRREDGYERGGPRAQSPRRSIRQFQEHGPPAGAYGDRQGRPYVQQQRAPGRDPHDRSPLTGNNYRNDRIVDRDAERGAEKMRDLPGFHQPGPRGQEPDQRMPHQDQNYGRLNPVPPSSDVPSGPRGRGRIASRGGHGGHSSSTGRPDGRFGAPETQRPPSPDRGMPPTGPASSISSIRGRRGGYEHGAGPVTLSGARNFGPGTEMQAPTPANGAPSSTGVHPERLAQMGAGPPPSSLPPPPPPPLPGLPPHGHSRHANPGDRHGSGLRQAHPGSMAYPPSASESGVPTGPASSNERLWSERNKTQLAEINDVLQQAQSMPDMGRHSVPRASQPRQMLGNSDAQVLTGGSPASTPGHERQDFVWHKSPSWGATNGSGDGAPRREHRGERENRSDRPNRSSRRSSRERERERSPRASREGEATEHSEYRERRLMGATEASGKERELRRQGRNVGGRDAMGPPPHSGGRGLVGIREPRHRGDEGSAGMRTGEDWAGHGSGYRGGRGVPREGGAMRPHEERREVRDDRGRKRRSEEGMGNLTSEREKRPRRG